MNEKTKTIKELLELLRIEITRRYNTDIFTGMCGAIFALNYRNYILNKEMNMLFEYLENNVPNNVDVDGTKDYWWEIGKIQPRYKWIDKHLNK